jgi:hypothetical protein
VNSDIWDFPPASGYQVGTDLTGFAVEAADGRIGQVDTQVTEPGGSYLVVDTGTWILGRRVLLPAGVIARVRPAARVVDVERTKDEIKNAPEFDPEQHPGHHEKVGGYYNRLAG